MNLMRAGPQHELWTRISTLLTPPPGGAVVKKPAALSYGLEERPPAIVTWISALQHVGVCSIFMVYPLIIARQAGLPAGPDHQHPATRLPGPGDRRVAPGAPTRTDRQPPPGADDLHRRLSRPFLARGEGRRHAAGMGHDDLRRRRGDGAVALLVAPASLHSTGIRRSRGLPRRHHRWARRIARAGRRQPSGALPAREGVVTASPWPSWLRSISGTRAG